jgi:hypothetical protein
LRWCLLSWILRGRKMKKKSKNSQQSIERRKGSKPLGITTS